jgi:A/G-specific adenine glycosylase
VMSQQTQIERVAERWPRWTRRWPTVESLAAATLADVLREWQGLGYPRRARDLHAAARRIEAEGWPAPHALEELPGVGRYTADAIRCFALGQPVLPGDANVRRVLARRFPGGLVDRGRTRELAGGPADRGRSRELAGPAEAGRSWELGGALMDLGRAHCRARPRCGGCPLRAGCMVATAADGWDPAARPRRQSAYPGSLRQRRGALLRATLAGTRPAASVDPQAAASLAADGLVSIERGLLIAPGASTAIAKAASIVGRAP